MYLFIDDLLPEPMKLTKCSAEHLADLDCQFFVTGVEQSDFLSICLKTCKMFHVEQGNITECKLVVPK